MKTLRLGTRKSALAQAQSNWVASQLRSKFPELHIELVLITTTGDNLNESVAPVGTVPTNQYNAPVGTVPTGGLKALFTKEIEEALLDNKIDLAVHSMK